MPINSLCARVFLIHTSILFMTLNQTYDKSNSILQMHGLSHQYTEVLSRILAIDYAKHIISNDDPLYLALEDLKVSQAIPNSKESIFKLRPHVLEEISRLYDYEIPRYLRYRYTYDVYPGMKRVGNYPPLVQIEPSSICNYRCIFCYQTDERLTTKKNGHMGFMDINLFKNLIDQLEGNVEAVTLASRGEPLMNKFLPEMIAHMDGKFLAAKINTNASLLTEVLSHAILSSDLQTLVFSADAAADPLYSKLRVGGNLDRVVGNIKRFYEIKTAHYPNSRLITRVSGVHFQEDQDMNEMVEFWSQYVDQVAFVDYNPWDNVYDAKENSLLAPCSDLWRRLFVWWDGRIGPCDVDYLTTLSNELYPDISISNVWNGDTFTNLRTKHLNNQRQDLNPCSRCVLV